jgi:hypothetical protein
VRFYLGTHEPSWLNRTSHPLFLSRRRLARIKVGFPRAAGPWALDSGGFSELSMYGRWETGDRQYAQEVARWSEALGRPPDFAAIQDWMCEPFMLAKTGLTVREHQRRTVDSYATLRYLDSSIPWAPVLQGWRIDDYLDHAEQYRAAGFDLDAAPAVGVGSVCRRQGTREIADLFDALRPLGLRLHGFGLKARAIRLGFGRIASCDSMAWSYRARRRAPLPGHTHKSCANCFEFAVRWRDQIASLYVRPSQERFTFLESLGVAGPEMGVARQYRERRLTPPSSSPSPGDGRAS